MRTAEPGSALGMGADAGAVGSEADALGTGDPPASGEPQALNKMQAISAIDLTWSWSRWVVGASSNLAACQLVPTERVQAWVPRPVGERAAPAYFRHGEGSD